VNIMDKVQISIIKGALDNEIALSDWEIQFVNDIAEKGDDYTLSEKQIEIVNRIGNKVALDGW